MHPSIRLHQNDNFQQNHYLFFFFFLIISSFICMFVLLPLPDTTVSHIHFTANQTHSGGGHVENFGGLNTYINGSPEFKKAIILASDVYGYSAPILRKIADKVAAAGFFVVVPDFTHGDPFDRNRAERPVPAWLKDHQTEDGFEDAKHVIEALKMKGISAIGAAGFCWGGKIVVLLGKCGLIEAAVLLHPSYTTVDDIAGIKVPISILGAEADSLAPPKLLKQFEVSLSAEPKVIRIRNFAITVPVGILQQVPNFVKVFPNVSHGWTLRYNEQSKQAVRHAEEAHQDMLNWFAKHVI